jgi:hypothetical protein
MNVLATLQKDVEPVMAIQDRSIPPDLQRAGLTGCKRGFQFAGGEAAKQVKFDPIQSAFRM